MKEKKTLCTQSKPKGKEEITVTQAFETIAHKIIIIPVIYRSKIWGPHGLKNK